jgi:hypothetical protein
MFGGALGVGEEFRDCTGQSCGCNDCRVLVGPEAKIGKASYIDVPGFRMDQNLKHNVRDYGGDEFTKCSIQVSHGSITRLHQFVSLTCLLQLSV